MPVLKYLNAEKFLETWLNLKPALRELVSNELVERYKYFGMRFIKDEQVFLNKLKKEIAQEKEHKKGKVSYLHLDNLEKKIEEIFANNASHLNNT
ncbi:hypothetical protein BegalDRAFT_0982 [Beggiatoa alba B18LD]|uniref:Uncharacterized protein n=2 Tax=Beggiatoa alba TaxID=1022 RepID=I3CE43_9GAMM|nr:hypothetical protein BegalDRAFT_0982 [Beggiatoa alba B18LD]